MGLADPPMLVSGMVNMLLGSDGSLYEFHRVPPNVDSLADPALPAVDWDRFFALAGLDRSRFQPAAPEWTPGMLANVPVHASRASANVRCVQSGAAG